MKVPKDKERLEHICEHQIVMVWDFTIRPGFLSKCQDRKEKTTKQGMIKMGQVKGQNTATHQDLKE